MILFQGKVGRRQDYGFYFFLSAYPPVAVLAGVSAGTAKLIVKPALTRAGFWLSTVFIDLEFYMI